MARQLSSKEQHLHAISVALLHALCPWHLLSKQLDCQEHQHATAVGIATGGIHSDEQDEEDEHHYANHTTLPQTGFSCCWEDR